MIYWFTGQRGVGKTVLGNKLRDFLQTEKRNWRKDVFLIDFAHHSQLGQAQIISTFFENESICLTSHFSKYLFQNFI